MCCSFDNVSSIRELKCMVLSFERRVCVCVEEVCVCVVKDYVCVMM